MRGAHGGLSCPRPGGSVGRPSGLGPTRPTRRALPPPPAGSCKETPRGAGTRGGAAGSGREATPGAAELGSLHHCRVCRDRLTEASRSGPLKNKKSCASLPSGAKHLEHSLFSAHRNSRLRTQLSHALPEPLSFRFSTPCNSVHSTFLPSPSFGEEVSVFRLRGESV